MKTHSKLKLLGCLPAENAQDALGNGTITEADIDERLRVQFNVRMQLGMKKCLLLSLFILKTIILQRQARDNHRKEIEGVFSQDTSILSAHCRCERKILPFSLSQFPYCRKHDDLPRQARDRHVKEQLNQNGCVFTAGAL